jgi:hypothetical protein
LSKESTLLKIAIVVRPQLSPAAIALACAHGALAGYLRWQHDTIVQEWVSGTFFKKILQPSAFGNWEAILRWLESLVMTESALEHLPVAIVFRPGVCRRSQPLCDIPLYGRYLGQRGLCDLETIL